MPVKSGYGTFNISTAGSAPRSLSERDFDAAVEAVFAEQAAQARAEKEAAARKRAQQERLWARGVMRARRERNIVQATEIAQYGQPPTEFPALTGTSKQIAYALEIRNEYALRCPGDRRLKTATRAQYWILNHRSVLDS